MNLFARKLAILCVLVAASCDQADKSSSNSEESRQDNTATVKEIDIEKLNLLKEMYDDQYFPKQEVDKVKQVLIDVCLSIESDKPQNLTELYAITKVATEKINQLQEDFLEAGSEIETVARDSIAVSFEAIANAYGYEADSEDMTYNRQW